MARAIIFLVAFEAVTQLLIYKATTSINRSERFKASLVAGLSVTV